MRNLPNGYINCFKDAFREKGIPILTTVGTIAAWGAGIVTAIYLVICVLPLWISATLIAVIAFLYPVIKRTRENIRYEKEKDLNFLEHEIIAFKWAHINKRFDESYIRRLRGDVVILHNVESCWGSNSRLKQIKKEFKTFENLYLEELQ